jgi:hypothetical protein
MHYNITPELINSTSFDAKFSDFIKLSLAHNNTEFNDVPGKEHYNGDYQQMITNYTFIYDAPEPTIQNFIARSYQNGNYVKCYEACKFVWKSYCLKKCTLNEQYLFLLYWYYMNCKKNLLEL